MSNRRKNIDLAELLHERSLPLMAWSDQLPKIAVLCTDAAKQIKQQRAEIAALRRMLERDRSAVALGINALNAALDSRRWLSEGRGSYAWNDDRYQSEFGEAINEIDAALRPLRAIAADWSGCPTDPAEIAAARAPAVDD